ncbi:unnamed protein product [Leptidea sinapis]|uniref:Histidine decarboxylase n=1 Tax=Leptidea sinapis TaxID=189913 RepID=A0A5E4Q2V7_9NEOP|nr:unnamed protein product [Leptidea sinapis]
MIGSQKANTKNRLNTNETGFNGKLTFEDDLHGYNKISSSCEETIQLENPDSKEPLHWQIPLSRRFRALKLWFVLRNYGVVGIQKHIREGVRLAQKFEALILADHRFEIPQPSNLGMVAFRLKGANTLTEMLLKRLNARGNIHAVPACFKGVYVIRFTVTSQRTTNQDIIDDCNEIKKVASEILIDMFGSENGNIVVSKKPRITLKEMRRRIRGIRMCGKKFSLDSYMDMVQGLMVEQPLPLCSEEEREDASNGSSPGEKPYIASSPVKIIGTTKQINNAESNQPEIPATSKQFRSRSIDAALSELTFEDAKVIIDMQKHEIIITPTENKSLLDEKIYFNAVDEKLKIGTSDDFGNVQDVQAGNDGMDENDTKLIIKAPGNYIQKLIQQFSEGNMEGEVLKQGSDRVVAAQSIRDKADAICRKCLHYKGKFAK